MMMPVSQQQSHSSAAGSAAQPGHHPPPTSPNVSSKTGQPTDTNDLFNELRKVYWTSVEKEAQNMIEFCVHLCTSDYLTLKPEIDLDSCSESFQKIFNVWVGCQSGLDRASLSDLYEETIRAAKDHFTTPRDKREWAARLILQASGLLDLDVLYEPTNGSQRYLSVQQNQPNVEQIQVCKGGQETHVVRGITCGLCQLLIKSPTFYQCNEGCKSPCFYETLPEDPNPPIFYVLDEMLIQDEAAAKYYPAYRLCSVCMSTANPEVLGRCDRNHLHELNYDKPDIKSLDTLCSKLTETEHHRQKEHDRSVASDSDKVGSGRIAKAKTRFMEKALRSTEGLWPVNPRLFLRTAGLMMKGHYAPSGNFHLSLMFGPLIFESGLPKTKHGVFISPRRPPAFFNDGGVGDIDDAWRIEPRPFFYWDKNTKKPHRDARKEEHPFIPRPILACLKRVYGAAFSGYPESAQPREDAVVQRLMQLGDSYMSIPREKGALERRALLKELAQDLRSSLQMCLGQEVDKHLSRIANILVRRKDRGEWSILTNNCQLLVNLLLGGDDFEYAIPLPPADLKEESIRWPRYLISFGNHIEGFGKSLYQPNGLMTQYNQSKPVVDYDLIEYIGRCLRSPSEFHSKSLARLCWFPSPSLPSQAVLDTLWTLPSDSLSLLQFHLLRPPHKYDHHLKSEKAWTQNRLHILQHLHIIATFTASLGNTLHRRLFAPPSPENTSSGSGSGGGHLLSRISIPPSRVLGNLRADERLNILDRLGPRWTFYDIENRTANAMRAVSENPGRFWRPAGAAADDDPVHGEEVVSRIVGWFLAPVAAVSPAVARAVGGSLRFHEGFWVAVCLGRHTVVRQYWGGKVVKVRA